MNSCELTTPPIDLDAKSFIPKSPVIVVDLLAPNIVQSPALPLNARAINRGLLLVQEVQRQRVRLRFDVECKVSWHGSMTYKRLRGSSVLLNAPNAEQAELFIQAIHDFAASLNGKWLAPRPESMEVSENQQDSPTPGPK